MNTYLGNNSFGSRIVNVSSVSLHGYMGSILVGTTFILFMMIIIVQMPSRCIFDATELSDITLNYLLIL